MAGCVIHPCSVAKVSCAACTLCSVARRVQRSFTLVDREVELVYQRRSPSCGIGHDVRWTLKSCDLTETRSHVPIIREGLGYPLSHWDKRLSAPICRFQLPIMRVRTACFQKDRTVVQNVSGFASFETKQASYLGPRPRAKPRHQP